MFNSRRLEERAKNALASRWPATSAWALRIAAVSLPLSLHCSEEQRVEEPGGTLNFTWTIDQKKTASECERLAASDFQVTVFYQGDVVSTYEAPCDDFELITGTLVPNDEYMARATLVDLFDKPKSDTVTFQEFTVNSDEMQFMEIHFGRDDVPVQPVDTVDKPVEPVDPEG